VLYLEEHKLLQTVTVVENDLHVEIMFQQFDICVSDNIVVVEFSKDDTGARTAIIASVHRAQLKCTMHFCTNISM
jgi:hypothetical protein